jgi:exopolysaccharide biosynthesis protein
VGINASYFGTTSSGFVRIDGKDVCAGTKYAADRYYQNNGVFVLNNNVAGIKAVENNAAAAQLPDENIQCCGPLLILDDVDEQQANVDHCNIDHPRTVVGVTADGRVLFVTVDGRFENKAIGMSTTMLQELMRLLGATHALNLDGGGSSTMYIKDRGVVNHVCNSGSTWDKVVERKVASILYVK